MSFYPSFSVVIPVLNNKEGFEKAIKSVLLQNYQAEVIVIDGGSSDGTVDVIKKYSNHINYWETGNDTGISNAFNRGIRQASGDLVAILNSDDYWEDDTITKVVDTTIKNPQYDIYFGDLRFHDVQSRTQYVLKSTLIGIERRMTLFHPSIFIRKSAYKKIGLYDETYKYAMDSEWMHRALKYNLSFMSIPSVLANMSLGGTSDVAFIKSLAEYRKSLITHRLQSPLKAWIYFVFFTFAKAILRVDILNHIYRNLRIRVKF